MLQGAGAGQEGDNLQMPLAVTRTPPIPELAVIRDASNRLQALTTHLPPKALQALANEVVSRLSANLHALEVAVAPIAPEQIEQLCSALVSKSPDRAATIISELRDEGTSIADIYQLHLAAAARRLGEQWESDELSFVDVTIGASRILGIMYSLRDAFRATRALEEQSVVFAAVPDEKHTIGISMAADLFRRDGWEVDLLLGATHDEIVEKVRVSDALVVGLTAHGVRSMAALVRVIAAIRIVNPAVYILVSGNIVEDADDLIELTGADGFAKDIDAGLSEMQRMLDLANAG
jgi:methanogenic corrinoid protein MtbC1